MSDQKNASTAGTWGLNAVPGIVRAVRTPLAFYALVAVLCAMIAYTAYTARGFGDPRWPLAVAGLAVFVFLVTVGIVAYSSLRRPDALTLSFSESDQSLMALVGARPRRTEAYDQLFEGFSDCIFQAFNPPFEVEFQANPLTEAAVATHTGRYKSGVSSQYLFFDRDSYDKGRRFFQLLAEKAGPDIITAIECRLLDTVDRPGYTFFAGEKRGRQALILYPSAVMDDGIPQKVIYLEGKAVNDLVDILVNFFRRHWDQARPVGDAFSSDVAR